MMSYSLCILYHGNNNTNNYTTVALCYQTLKSQTRPSIFMFTAYSFSITATNKHVDFKLLT